MRQAMALADRGWGRVHPNPLVGAIVRRGTAVVGEGWHAEFGGDHAEVVALAAAGERARGATLYVTLEPCVHFGKRPPCVDAIVAAGIVRVVVGLRDPNPEAAGGAERLRAAGIAVDMGVLASKIARQNFRFVGRFVHRTRPFVTVKLAVSMDGMIADSAGHSRWISGDAARDWVQRLRAGYAGVGVGGHTALVDDVRLTVRGDVTPRVAPTRIVFYRTPHLAAVPGILWTARDVPLVMVFTREPAPADRATLERAGATVLVAGTLDETLHALLARDIDALLVEGGGRLAGALFTAGVVDRIHQVQAPVWLGDGVPGWGGLGAIALSRAQRWHTVERQPLGDDTLLTLEP